MKCGVFYCTEYDSICIVSQLPGTDDLWFGWSDFNAGKDIYQYRGLIKEIRIWNFAKTEVQIFNDRNKMTVFVHQFAFRRVHPAFLKYAAFYCIFRA